ncbi:MAG: VanZ family protein [Candidatus Latescibacterota bacterium]|nr:MAG: VanZ family protein [Candidatus Latescibacterota bacterium]
MFQNRFRLLPLILYVVLIFSLSSIPSLTAPGLEIVPADKIAHTVEYLLLGVLLFKTIGWSVTPSRAAAFAFLFAVGVSVAAVDEFYQSFIPGRMMSIADWCADALGVGLGVGIFTFVGKKAVIDTSGVENGPNAQRPSDGKTL